MSTRYFLIAATLVSAGSLNACPVTDPVAAARAMYTEHHDFYADPAHVDFLSPALTKLLKRDWACQAPGDECAIGADPWVDAQDGGALAPIEYVQISTDATSAIVEMRYRFGWEEMADQAVPLTTTIALVRTSATGCWLLDDLRVREQSLHSILTDYEY